MMGIYKYEKFISIGNKILIKILFSNLFKFLIFKLFHKISTYYVFKNIIKIYKYK